MTNPDMLKKRLSGSFATPDVACVVQYIQRIWNENRLMELSVYLDDHYIDHSMPHVLVQNREGLMLYLDQLARMVSHTTEIIELTTLGEIVICQVKITAHSPLGDENVCQETEVFFGYRMFRMLNNKIAEHWEIL